MMGISWPDPIRSVIAIVCKDIDEITKMEEESSSTLSNFKDRQKKCYEKVILFPHLQNRETNIFKEALE